ncbi:hypothetical protein U1Q18_009166 [Sarracenia purpurea var. burkii]
MNQPMISGKRQTKSELKYATDQALPLLAIDLYWELALPSGTNRDHRYSNPMVDGPHREKIKSLGAVFGDRIRRRSDDRQAIGIRENVGVEWSSGGSAVRRYRVPRDRLDRFLVRIPNVFSEIDFFLFLCDLITKPLISIFCMSLFDFHMSLYEFWW